MFKPGWLMKDMRRASERSEALIRAEQAEAKLAKAITELNLLREAARILANAEIENESLRTVLEASQKALKPFANAVFNDNGDMTVSPCHDSYDSFIAAYFAERKARAALAQTSPAMESSDGARALVAKIS